MLSKSKVRQERFLGDTGKCPKKDSVGYRIAWGVLAFLAGASLLCVFAVLNKRMTDSPMVSEIFLVPVLFGGCAGLAIGLLFLALKQRTRKEKIESSKLRLTEEAMRKARRLESLSVLAGGVAHDFDNILQGILGYAELVRRALPADSPERGMIEKIEKEGRRAAHLSRQMLAYSGKGTFLVSRLDLAGLVDAGEIPGLSPARYQ